MMKKISVSPASAAIAVGLTCAAIASTTTINAFPPGRIHRPRRPRPGLPRQDHPMRTVITIRSNNHPTFDLYFTPPGQPERLVDRVVYTRQVR
jgi:hypothetical protein